MKKLFILLTMLIVGIGSMWAETSTWESKKGFTQASGGVGAFYWYGVHTPGDASTKYSLTAIQLMQQTGNDNNDNYLAIARVSATSTLDANHVVAISDNHVLPTSSSGTLVTYNFSDGVELLGGTTYYFVFLSANTQTNGAYPVRKGRLSLNHTDYGTYAYGNSAGQAKWWFYYKAEVESSSATGFCTGDILGGSMESGNWKNQWTSGTTPSFTITCTASNINNSTSKPAGGLDIRSGQVMSAVYTITAPTGYVITGYKLFGKALTTNQTVTPVEGGAAVTFTTVGNSLCVSGLRKASTTFTLADSDNSGLFLNAMQVTLSSYASIASLPTANNKAYVIANARGTWNFADDATAMNAITPANMNLDNSQQQIALIYKNENYYLFSVNAGKYLTASNTLTSMPTDNEQVDIIATENATYPWFFRFKNLKDKNDKYTKFINTTDEDIANRIKIDGWGPDGSTASGCLDDGNRNSVIEVSDFDPTVALAMFTTRTVTYNLSYGGNSTFRTVSEVTVSVDGDPAEFLPSSFANSFVSLSYSPATIAAETTEVTVTATWNGPFQISDSYASANWQVVQMHANSTYRTEKWSWSYKSDDSNKVKPEQVLEYDAVTTNRLFCFVGNPYDGFKIYNAAVGSGYTLTRSGESDEISMASGDHIFTLHTSEAQPDISKYFCLKPSGATNYVNFDYTDKKIAGYEDADNGSTCWVVAPGQYYLDFIDGLYLDAPVGAVGTRAYFQTVADVETVKSNIRGYRTTVAANMYSNELGSLNTYLNPVKSTDVITLTNGYYRVISAVPGFNHTAAWYYNPSNDATHITWAKAATTSEQQVNSIFKFEGSDESWTIYSPNAQQYITTGNGTWNAKNAELGDAAVVEVESIDYAQYTLKQTNNAQTLHAQGHSDGSGNSGNLVTWNANTPGTASAWYIVKVEDVDISLNNGGDGNYYATLCVPFDVTISDDATAYTLAKSESGNYLVPTAVEDNKVPAGTPVLLKGTNETATATINTGSAFGSRLDCALTGTYVATTIAGSTDYVLGRNDGKVGFYHWNSNNLAANRAYLAAESVAEGARGFALMFEDDATGIVAPIGETEEETTIYNLSGQRLNKMQKGINIVNGKKVLF